MTVELEIQKLAENVKATHESLSQTFEEFKHTQQESLKDFMKKGDVDPLLKEAREKMAADMVKFQEAMDLAMVKMQRPVLGVDSHSDKEAEFKNAKAFFNQKAYQRGQLPNGRQLSDDKNDLNQYRAYKSAFERVLRAVDDRRLNPEEIKALSVGSDPDGGYTVTPEMSNRIIERTEGTWRSSESTGSWTRQPGTPRCAAVPGKCASSRATVI